MAVNQTGVVYPKTSGAGILVDPADPTYPWQDIIGAVIPDPTSGPTRAQFRTGVNAYAFNNGKEVDYCFHMPHDYAPGSDIFIHVHWAHNAGTSVTGNIVFDFVTSYAKGHNQEDFIAPVASQITYALTNIATTPRYRHRIDEVQLTAASPSGAQFASSLLEVDGVIQGTMTVTVPGGGNLNTTSPANSIYVFTIDIHYQSTGIGTKNKAPNFYG